MIDVLITTGQEELQNTNTCIKLMDSGPFAPEKRDIFLRKPVQELQFPLDFDEFTRHHEFLMRLLAKRSLLNQELSDLQNSEEQQSHSEDSPNRERREQFRRIANAILASEGRILALLSLMSSMKEVEDLSPATHEESKREVSSLGSWNPLLDSSPTKGRQIETNMELKYPSSSGRGIPETWRNFQDPISSLLVGILFGAAVWVRFKFSPLDRRLIYSGVDEKEKERLDVIFRWLRYGLYSGFPFMWNILVSDHVKLWTELVQFYQVVISGLAFEHLFNEWPIETCTVSSIFLQLTWVSIACMQAMCIMFGFFGLEHDWYLFNVLCLF